MIPHLFFGALQIPVDSFYATSGGRKMVISKKLQGINHHHTIQRQRYAVYQTRRFIASNSYPYCQAGLAPSRRLRQNDADRQGLWYFSDFSLSTPYGRYPPARSALQRTTPAAKSGSFVGATRFVMTLGRHLFHREYLRDFQAPWIPAQLGGASQRILSTVWSGATLHVDDDLENGGV